MGIDWTKQKPIVIQLQGGLVVAVYIDDERYQGTEAIVVEDADEVDSDRDEAYVEGGELDGTIIYMCADIGKLSATGFKSVVRACKEYKAQ